MSVVAEFLPGQTPGGAEVARAMIGAEGGSLRLGDYEIVVPAGAVSKQTLFMIRIPPTAAQRVHASAEFLPHNVQFAVPVRLRLPHASTNAEPGSPALWWADSYWVELETVHLPDGRIETLVDHFSYYATCRRGITMAGG